MVRYIDAELLESKYREGTDPQDPYSEIAYLLPEDIESIPTADVEPVRHGRWVNCVDYKKVDDVIYYGYTSCSACGKMQQYGYKTKYCPYCGAKMDGDTDA